MSAKQTPKVELDGAALVITVPMTLRRRSGRKEVHVPLGLPRASKAKDKPSALALAVARAYRWQEQLEAGQYQSTTELAEAQGRSGLRVADAAADVFGAVARRADRARGRAGRRDVGGVDARRARTLDG